MLKNLKLNCCILSGIIGSMLAVYKVIQGQVRRRVARAVEEAADRRLLFVLDKDLQYFFRDFLGKLDSESSGATFFCRSYVRREMAMCLRFNVAEAPLPSGGAVHVEREGDPDSVEDGECEIVIGTAKDASALAAAAEAEEDAAVAADSAAPARAGAAAAAATRAAAEAAAAALTALAGHAGVGAAGNRPRRRLVLLEEQLLREDAVYRGAPAMIPRRETLEAFSGGGELFVVSHPTDSRQGDTVVCMQADGSHVCSCTLTLRQGMPCRHYFACLYRRSDRSRAASIPLEMTISPRWLSERRHFVAEAATAVSGQVAEAAAAAAAAVGAAAADEQGGTFDRYVAAATQRVEAAVAGDAATAMEAADGFDFDYGNDSVEVPAATSTPLQTARADYRFRRNVYDRIMAWSKGVAALASDEGGAITTTKQVDMLLVGLEGFLRSFAAEHCDRPDGNIGPPGSHTGDSSAIAEGHVGDPIVAPGGKGIKRHRSQVENSIGKSAKKN